MAGTLNEDDWIELWENNILWSFHKNKVHPDLVKHENLFLPKPSRVLMPLCGKSHDLAYLADKGHDVHGSEFIEKAVKDFFSEHSIQYQVTENKSYDIKVFKGINKKVTLYQGDFFALNSEVIGKFDAVWDRASLVAINIDQRESYARIMYDVMSPNCKYLLNSYTFHGENYHGPPHSITDETAQALFGRFCDISFLDSHEGDISFQNAGYMEVTNRLLRKK